MGDTKSLGVADSGTNIKTDRNGQNGKKNSRLVQNLTF